MLTFLTLQSWILPRMRIFEVKKNSPLWIALTLCLVLAGCMAGDEATMTSLSAGLSCVDDTPNCIRHRQETLKLLVSDPQRSWIQEKPDALAYASGVRLFAYKKKKKELTCPELMAGRSEADAAPSTLKSSNHGLSTAQISRSLLLAGEIGRELTKEYGARCKKT